MLCVNLKLSDIFIKKGSCYVLTSSFVFLRVLDQVEDSQAKISTNTRRANGKGGKNWFGKIYQVWSVQSKYGNVQGKHRDMLQIRLSAFSKFMQGPSWYHTHIGITIKCSWPKVHYCERKDSSLGTIVFTNLDEFSENFQTASERGGAGRASLQRCTSFRHI